jgi:hypothetical protein
MCLRDYSLSVYSTARESRRGNDESGKAEMGLFRSLTLSASQHSRGRSLSLSPIHTLTVKEREREVGGTVCRSIYISQTEGTDREHVLASLTPI